MKDTPDNLEEALFEEALEIRCPKERAAFVERSCCGDSELRRKLELLLEGHFGGEGFLTEIPSTTPAETARQIGGRYSLLEKIGEGGFGEVWLAEQSVPVKRRVAIKVLKLGMNSKQVVARFEAERQALAIMDHPNIAKVFDGGITEEGRPFFAMELVEGRKITDYCKEHALSLRDRLQLFMVVCQAVQHAHQKGVIHRDLKPSNVLVIQNEGNGLPKVIDFGIAKAIGHELTEQTIATGFLQLMGTPAYISPEQALLASKDVDTRSDIYSLGILLYELLTGRPPFENHELLTAGVDEMRRTIASKEPLRPRAMRERIHREIQNGADPSTSNFGHDFGEALNPDLDWIVMKCLEKDASRRYQTANGLAMDVQRYLRNEPVVARPPSTFYRVSKLLKRNPVTASLALLLMLAIAAALVLTTWMNVRLTRAKKQTDQANRALSKTLISLESANMEERAAKNSRSQPIAWLAARLRANPEDRSAAARLISMLGEHSFALPLLLPLKHPTSVNAVSFSPDETEIMTGCEDGKVRFWDAKRGQLLRVLEQPARVAQAAYVAHGTRLRVIDQEGVLRVYSLDNTLLFENHGLRRPYPTYESANGKKLFAESAHEISQWNLTTGVRIEPTIRTSEAILASDYSDQANGVAILTKDNTVEIRDLDSGLLRLPARRFAGAILDLKFSRDGKKLYISENRPRLHVWNFATDGSITELALPSVVAQWIYVPPEDRRLLIWTWQTPFRLIDLRTGKQIGDTIQAGVNAHVAASPDGQLGVTLGQNGNSLVFDLSSGKVLLDPLQHDGPVTAASFSADHSRLITGSVDGMARVWDIRMRKPVRPQLPATSGGGAASFDHAGKRVVTSVSAEGVQVFDAKSARPVGPILTCSNQNAIEIKAAWFSPDDARILTVAYPNSLRVWNASTYEPELDLVASGRISSGGFSPNGLWVIAINQSGGGTIWDSRSGKQIASMKHGFRELVSFDIDAKSEKMVTASIDGSAFCWSLPDAHQLLPPLRHGGIVWNATFSPDGTRIITASSDKTARIWDCQTGQPIGNPFRHAGEVFFARFSPDGRSVVTSSADGTARVWDATTGEPVTPILTHKEGIWQAVFTPDGRTLITGSIDLTVRFWDATSGLPMSEPLLHDGFLGTVSVSSDGRHLLTFGGRPRLWEITMPPVPAPAWMSELAEAIAGIRQAKDTQLVPGNPAIIEELRQRVAQDQSKEFYIRWARWLLLDRMREGAGPFQSE